jgi:HEAT repeat protein
MKNPRIHFALAAALLCGVAAKSFAQTAPLPAKEQEAKLLAVLQSGASQKEKADACRELAHVGTKDAVPVLATLLDDEQLAHMARYGLETIPSPAVDKALRDALAKLKGRHLIGVITSLGVRQDADAVKPLGELLQDADADVADAAARALGQIATKSAAQTLDAALAGAAKPLPICEGLFRCAEAFVKKGQRKDAIEIFDRLRNLPNAAHQVRAGALRGAVLARGKDGVPLLAEAIRGSDWVLADAAARTAMEIPGPAVTKALTDSLGAVTGDRQVLVFQTLGKRADAGAVPAVIAAARSGEKSVWIAAIRALAEIGDGSAAPALAELLRDTDGGIAEAARDSLAGLQGAQADAAVLALVKGSDAQTKLSGLDLVARRRMASALPELERASGDADAKVRAAALKQMAELGGEPEFTSLLAKLARASEPDDVTAVEESLVTICARLGKPEVRAEKLMAQLSAAAAPQKAALLRVLGSVGGAKALGVVRAAVDDTNPSVHAAALTALNAWPNVEVAPELLALAKSLASAEEKTACLRSYLRWAADADVSVKQRLAMCHDAVSLAERSEEKKLLLAALGGIQSPEAVTQILPFLEDAATREEACVAIVGIGEKLAKAKDTASLSASKAGLEKAAGATANADLASRAKALLDAIK